ncbi:MAG: mechanosensitive ion channel family protein [Desulfosalsimonadaceae bacterium]
MFQRILEAINFDALAASVMGYMPKFLSAILLILLFWIIIRTMNKVIRRALERTHMSEHARRLLQRFVKYIVVVIATLTVADQLGINIASLIAGVGIAGLAFSFAAQDTIANFISGVAIIIDQPFKEGDWISIGNLHASVSEIRLRTTVLTTFDNETAVVPNKQLAQERVINYTLTPKIRVRVPVGIAYKEDMQKAREVMLNTLAGDDRIMSSPPPAVLVTSLGDSSVNLEMRFWTENPVQKYPLSWEYTEKCKKALDSAGIEIPFPHMQVFVEDTEGVKRLAGRGI